MTEPGYPCSLCQVRPDVSCRHRAADTSRSMGVTPKDEDGRKTSPSRARPGNGNNFRRVKGK